ncbi:Tyrosine- phosphatase Lar [Paramuricea clavata]|uniref:Tyrosine- phosphatase Lar n=1 Tax=Paramuricea clavata TaxID=317549 RepID=A0A6S7HMD8_PARCT|nr:Tyrosine- phosphatase Lar [Paramuricea clavata]
MAKLASKGIKWKFIVEHAPWQGGWWERLVCSVKEPLHKVLGKSLLLFTELTTVLVKIEAVINSRPLTTVSDNVNDDTPITPAHLAIGRSLVNLPDAMEEIELTDSERTIRRYLYQQKLVNHFWKRWRNEYLHKLSVRHKWTNEEASIKIGDVVLISDDNVSRGRWPMGRVEQIHPGNDGLIRAVTLRTRKGTLRRPVQRLHRLEVAENMNMNSSKDVPHCGEVNLKKQESHRQKGKTLKTTKKMNSDIKVLQARWRSGEDVRTQTSRSGRVIKPRGRLDL